MKKLISDNKGITLIALVVTIIVLIVLAGVSINLILGENGIVHRSKEARFKTQFRDIEEKVALYKADKELEGIMQQSTQTNIEKLPLGDKITDITAIDGYTDHLKNEIEEISEKNVSEVKLYYINKDVISTTQKHTYIIDINTLQIYDVEGEEFFGVWHHTLEKLTGINVGDNLSNPTDPENPDNPTDPDDPTNPDDGESYTIVEGIPVPLRFYYVGGTKETGIVISDNVEDENKYKNQTTVGTDLKGNQFVWVPVRDMSYTYNRYAFTRDDWEYSQTIDTSTGVIKQKTYSYTQEMPSDEKTSVDLYGGFYIGRYETGIVGFDSTVITSNSNEEESWTGYSNGVAVIKNEQQVWNYITKSKAQEVSENLYNKESGDSVNAKLCSGYAWDTTLKFIETNDPDYPTYTPQGNYQDKAETLGKPALTGKTESVNNIYDMGGNVEDLTTETCMSPSWICVSRGSNFSNNFDIHTAAYRKCQDPTWATSILGFRVVLFL